MSSSYGGVDLFGSGPHRFHEVKHGLFTVTEFALGIMQSGTVSLGVAELEVVVTGRLVAGSEAALWALRDAITARVVHPPVRQTLIDHHGRQWTDMSFLRFEPADRTDRGRVLSLRYAATFRRFRAI